MTRYRIALVVDHFLPRVGGIELQVADLARQLASRGHFVEVLTATPGEGWLESTGPTNGAPCRVPVRRLRGPRLPGFEIAWQPRSFRELCAALEQGHYDVVHCHSSVVSPLAYGAAFLCRKLKIPSVLTVHSLLGVYQPLFRGLHPLLPWSRWPTRLTAVSRAAARVMSRLSGRADVGVLANGIDPAAWNFDPAPANAERKEVRVTSVTRLNVKKRAHALLDAVPEVCRQLPAAAQPRFTIIGDGPCRQRLERQAARLGIAHRVEFLGALPRTAIREVFGRSDLFALPTRNEAFGIAVLEARCAGLPVVAMRGCGVSDLIEPGNQGFLAGSQAEFVQSLVRLIADAPLRRAMAARTRLGVDEFDWEHVVARHVDVYAAAIAACTPTAHEATISQLHLHRKPVASTRS